MKDYFKLIPASYVIFRRGDEILLLQRANTGYLDGSYSLPAGHFDGDESAVNVAIREAKEEVGVSINAEDLQLKHTLHRLSTIPIKNERIDLFFETSKWSGEIKNMEPEKSSGLKWVTYSNLPEKMVPEVRQALERIVAGESFSEMNF
ncbi:MAG: NUDIX domain-containing protein [Candidatus Saccharimonadales bacterium]